MEKFIFSKSFMLKKSDIRTLALSKRFQIGVLLVVAALLRFWQFEYIPFQSDGDELAYVFAGQSLLETGVPSSWSSFSYPEQYSLGKISLGDEKFYANGDFEFVRPWLDHPPLLAIISGAWVKLFGYSFPSIPPSMVVRFPTVILSIFTLFLTYCVAKKEFGHKAGILSISLLALSPSIIFAQRMLVGENWVIPLLLLAILSLQYKKNIAIPIILAILVALIKVTGLLLIPVMFIGLFQERKYYRAAIFAVISTLLFVIVYSAYGFSINWNQFTELLSIQSHRLLGWGNFAFLLSHPGFHTIPILDASYYLIAIIGMFGMTLDSLKEKTQRYGFITLSSIFSLFLIWVTSAEQDMLGWYKLPLFIFLGILAGRGLEKLLEKKNTLLLASLLVAAVSISNFALIKYPEHPFPEAQNMRLVLGILLALFAILYSFQGQIKKKIINYFFFLAMIFFVGSTAYVIENYYPSLCKDRHCPVPLVTSAGWLRSLAE